jgi:hypothetical protein
MIPTTYPVAESGMVIVRSAPSLLTPSHKTTGHAMR